jgi:hypothetical protein
MNAIVILILVIVIASFYSYKLGKSNADMNNLQGFYESNSDFNNESGINSFTFYIGNYCGGSYPTYLLMIGNEDDKILVNTPSSMILTTIWTSSDCDCYEFNAKFVDLNSEFLPNNMTLKFYPKSGKIILCGNDIVYGCFFKNPVLTEIDLIKNQLKNTPTTTKNIPIKNNIKNLEEDAP